MILNKQKKIKLARRPLQAFLRRAKSELNIAGSEITVALVSDEEIAGWNEQYRHKKGPTDVLSFPAVAGALSAAFPCVIRTQRAAPPSASTSTPLASRHSSLFLGDIAIAPETAQRYARKNGGTLARELRVLILHGVLHLMGFDHETDEGQMNRIERKLRRKLGIA